jgi:hypothetical protein
MKDLKKHVSHYTENAVLQASKVQQYTSCNRRASGIDTF